MATGEVFCNRVILPREMQEGKIVLRMSSLRSLILGGGPKHSITFASQIGL